MKKFLTYEEAVSLLPDGETVHTFINMSFGLCGADWNREDVLDKLQKSEIIELTGEQARALGHGMCAYNKDAKRQSDILFIETDADKLAELDKDGGEEVSPLIPCPFCGSPAELRETDRVPSGYNYTPRCTVKSCAGRLSKLWMNKEDAIKAWNRRANDEGND